MVILSLNYAGLENSRQYRSKADLFSSLDKVAEGEPVLLVYKDSWADVDSLLTRLYREGRNPYLIDVVDPVYESKLALGYVSPETIIRARHSRLAASVARRAYYRVRVDKRVGRREILFNPFKSLIEYLYAPILTRPGDCESLRSCTICVDSCPYNALRGKPPSVDVDLCVSCGVCLHLCPVEALSMPRTTLDGIEYYASIVSRELGGSGLVVIIDFRQLKTLYSLNAGKLGSPVLVFPVDSIVEVTPLMLARFGQRSLHPVIYAPSLNGLDSKITDVLEEVDSIGLVDIAESVEDIQVLSRRPRHQLEAGYASPRDYVKELIHASIGNALLSSPLAGTVSVDGNKCTLCGACSNVCPVDALRVVEDDGLAKLLFEYDKCIACRECESSCPEDALTVKWEARRGLSGLVVEVASSSIARCRNCGAPIGPLRLVKAIEARLRERGVPQTVLDSVWLCNSCKVQKTFHGSV